MEMGLNRKDAQMKAIVREKYGSPDVLELKGVIQNDQSP